MREIEVGDGQRRRLHSVCVREVGSCRRGREDGDS
jgi:hypothetical protein